MNKKVKDELKTFWEHLTFSYNGERGLIDQYWAELCDYYLQPCRYYHNLAHIQSLVKLIEKYQAHILNPQALFFAAFYHDIIYDVTRSDNEVKSAELAEKRLKELHVDKQAAALAADIIRHTARHQKTGNFDINLFLDFDRSILSAPPEEYQQYATLVRKEFGIFSNNIYTSARAKMIAQYLEAPEIYYTAVMKVHEQAARRNLQNELENLHSTAG